MPSAGDPLYDRSFAPTLYDIAAAALFAPFGGVAKLRNQALDEIGIAPGTRVLELGCGTGGITSLLVQRGAMVHAVDGSATMLERTRRNAPGAILEQASFDSLRIRGSFDVALLAFVLHELPRTLRHDLLSRAFAAAKRVAIVDHAVPASRLGPYWSKLLFAIETPTIRDFLAGGPGDDVRAAGGQVLRMIPLARGAASLTLAEPTAA